VRSSSRQDLDELGSLIDKTAQRFPIDLARHGHLHVVHRQGTSAPLGASVSMC
jgi:hypothetical protein